MRKGGVGCHVLLRLAGGRRFHEFGSIFHKWNLGCPVPSTALRTGFCAFRKGGKDAADTITSILSRLQGFSGEGQPALYHLLLLASNGERREPPWFQAVRFPPLRLRSGQAPCFAKNGASGILVGDEGSKPTGRAGHTARVLEPLPAGEGEGARGTRTWPTRALPCDPHQRSGRSQRRQQVRFLTS